MHCKRKNKCMFLLFIGFILVMEMLQLNNITYATNDKIRVALFVDTGKYYRMVVPSLTLSGNSGMEIRTLMSNGMNVMYGSLNDNSKRKFSLDSNYLSVKETNSLTEAGNLAEQLKNKSLNSTIFKYKKNNIDVYEVAIIGSSSSSEEILKVKNSLKSMNIDSVLKGNLRLESKIYNNFEEASAALNEFSKAGFISSMALSHNMEGKLQYRVWLGNESDLINLSNLQKVLKEKFPTYEWKQVLENHYLLSKISINYSDSYKEIPHYFFNSNQTLKINPKNGNSIGLIKVDEKSNRSYRGIMEIQGYNGFPSLINELGIEEYLYGVVGSEMSTGWPLEALKTQAVLARTRALGEGNKYGIANLSDSTYEQAYHGYDREYEDIRQAVDSTKGEVILYQEKLVSSLYSSNMGGQTGEGNEVWGGNLPYLQSVYSDDLIPEKNSPIWYQIYTEDGSMGYVHSQYIQITNGKNPIGLLYGIVTQEGLNLRNGPSTTFHRIIKNLKLNEKVKIIRKVPQHNAYSWIRGYYTSKELTDIINKSQSNYNEPLFVNPISTLTISKKGASGRVIEIKADDKIIKSSSPDSYRTVLGGIYSNKFEIEEMGKYTILGSNNKKVSYPNNGNKLYVHNKDLKNSEQLSANSNFFAIYNSKNEVRITSTTPYFNFIGYGYGHGLGVSQYGAKSMAEKGNTYKEIISHYYKDIVIEKYKK